MRPCRYKTNHLHGRFFYPLANNNWDPSEINKIQWKLPFSPICGMCVLAQTRHFCCFYKMATCNRHLKSNKVEKLQIAFWIYLFRVFAWKVALQESKMAVQGKWKMTKVLPLLIYLIDALRLHNCISLFLCFFLIFIFLILWAAVSTCKFGKI